MSAATAWGQHMARHRARQLAAWNPEYTNSEYSCTMDGMTDQLITCVSCGRHQAIEATNPQFAGHCHECGEWKLAAQALADGGVPEAEVHAVRDYILNMKRRAIVKGGTLVLDDADVSRAIATADKPAKLEPGEKRGPGQPPKPAELRLLPITMRLKAAHKAKLIALGRDWLADVIEHATLPAGVVVQPLKAEPKAKAAPTKPKAKAANKGTPVKTGAAQKRQLQGGQERATMPAN